MHPVRAQHREFEAPPALRGAVKCIWYDRIDGAALSTPFEVLPDGYVEIIFHCGGACGMSVGGRLQRLPSPFMMGLLKQPVVLHADGQLDIVGIRCYPWAVFDLLGLAAGSDSVRLFAHPIARLQATLEPCLQAGRLEEAVAHLERHLIEVRSHMAIDGVLARAGAALVESNGTMPVGEVAAAAHATVRTLERRFRQFSGHTVKEVAGVMRFEQVRNALFLQPHASIAALAPALGYVDQSHLSREFKRYTGTTPAAFARRRS